MIWEQQNVNDMVLVVMDLFVNKQNEFWPDFREKHFRVSQLGRGILRDSEQGKHMISPHFLRFRFHTFLVRLHIIIQYFFCFTGWKIHYCLLPLGRNSLVKCSAKTLGSKETDSKWSERLPSLYTSNPCSLERAMCLQWLWSTGNLDTNSNTGYH